MFKIKIPSQITKAVAKTTLKVSQHSPQILFGAGIAGVVGTAVLASRATLHIGEVLDEAQVMANNLDLASEREDFSSRYSADDINKARALLRVRTGLKIVKLYLPAIVLGSLSIAALTGSHRILTTRNAALTAAYAGLDKSFREYRARVLDEVGEEKEALIRYGATEEKVVEVDETGKKTVVKKQVAGQHYSDYARLFEESNPNWTDRPELNLIWLRGIQQMANDRLNAKGFVLLNSVYKDLGLPETTAGSVVGWVTKRNGGKDGDIDFGLFNDDLRLHDYMTTREGNIWLDFNVDGQVNQLIDEI